MSDPRNESIWAHVGGELLPRAQAKVSVFDSSVQGGDAVWEGLRVSHGRVFSLDRHLDRLFASAKSLGFSGTPSPDEVTAALMACLARNGMRDGAHVRLTLTRGRKVTSGMDPRNNQFGCCLIVLPEWKANADTRGRPLDPAQPISLVTARTRRNSAQCLDSRIHHANLLNNILAKLEANAAGADDALMLDVDGLVAETNATNVFIVEGSAVSTPIADQCLAGITRGHVMELCAAAAIPCHERRVRPEEARAATEMFVTGTLGGITAVGTLDGRPISTGQRGPITAQLQALYGALLASSGTPIPD